MAKLIDATRDEALASGAGEWERRLLRAMFDAAIAAAQPALFVPANLPPAPKGRTIVIGAGKASAAMAQTVECNWPGQLEGLVVTKPSSPAWA